MEGGRHSSTAEHGHNHRVQRGREREREKKTLGFALFKTSLWLFLMSECYSGLEYSTLRQLSCALGFFTVYMICMVRTSSAFLISRCSPTW